MTWREVNEFADVRFGKASISDDIVIIPVEIYQRPENSLHVLWFASKVARDSIELHGKLLLPENAPTQTDQIRVQLKGTVLPQYSLVYKDPDGSVKLIQVIQSAGPTGNK